MDKAFENFKSC